jgi:hypothetical protein
MGSSDLIRIKKMDTMTFGPFRISPASKRPERSTHTGWNTSAPDPDPWGFLLYQRQPRCAAQRLRISACRWHSKLRLAMFRRTHYTQSTFPRECPPGLARGFSERLRFANPEGHVYSESSGLAAYAGISAL